MHGGVLHDALRGHAPKSLVSRGGLARTFGGLAGFVVLLFLGGGSYILEEAFANPLAEGATPVFCAALMITLAAVLLFFLFKPSKRPRSANSGRSAGATAHVPRPFLQQLPRPVRQGHARSNLPYQRIYIDHSFIRP